MLAFVGVFGQASGVASYPFLSRLAIEKKFDEMNQLLNNIVTKIGIYLMPICGVMMVLSDADYRRPLPAWKIYPLIHHGHRPGACTVSYRRISLCRKYHCHAQLLCHAKHFVSNDYKYPHRAE